MRAAAVKTCHELTEREHNLPNPGHTTKPAAPQPRDCLSPAGTYLTIGDYSHLERHLRDIGQKPGSYASGLSQLIRRKLENAYMVFPGDVPADAVTGNSRIMFAIAGGPEKCRIVVHRAREFVPGMTLLVPTPLGVTLLGMTAGQSALLTRGDGTTGTVKLIAVEYQPERARRSAPLRREQGQNGK